MSSPRRTHGSFLLFFVLSLLVLGLAPASARAQCLEGWLPGDQPSGFTSTVYAATLWDPDGPGPLSEWLVVAGSGSVPGVSSPRIAAWDGSRWHALGSGFASTVTALVVFRGELYAGGDFTQSGLTSVRYMGRWSGSSWVQVGAGSGLNNSVTSFVVHNDELYFAGYFTAINGSPLLRVAKYDGTVVSPVGAGFDNGYVQALHVHDGAVHAGGTFTSSNAVNVLRVARFNGSVWTAVGGGIDSSSGAAVNALATFGTDLIAAGTFTSVGGGTLASNIARWNGTAWAPLAQGLNGSVNALTIYNFALVATGSFSQSGALNIGASASWNGTTWTPIGPNSSTNYALLTYQGRLLIAGTISDAGGIRVDRLALWDGFAFSALGNSIAGQVSAVIEFGGQLVAAGRIPSAGTNLVSNICTYDGAQWLPLGLGVDAQVRAMVRLGNDLIVGGDFFVAGGTQSIGAARWNGSAWFPMPGLNSSVYTLHVFNGELYAGGAFSSRVARWNGSTWTSFGTPLNGQVECLATFGNQLVAGGSFSQAGTTVLNYVARFDGSTWQPFGTGVNSTVNTLTVHNGELYAGGSFSASGDSASQLRNVARWTGANWTAVGQGLNSTVFALRPFAGELVATGQFTSNIEGTTMPYVARWNGVSWRSFGTGLATGANFGLSGRVLLERNGLLLVGGSFMEAGGRPSPSLATWTPGGGTITFAQQPQSQTVCSTGSAVLSVVPEGPGPFSFRWRKNGSALFDSRGINGSDSALLNITYLESSDSGIYECVVTNICGPIASAPATLTVDTNCPAPCNRDFNGDGEVNADDLADYINVYFGGCP